MYIKSLRSAVSIKILKNIDTVQNMQLKVLIVFVIQKRDVSDLRLIAFILDLYM